MATFMSSWTVYCGIIIGRGGLIFIDFIGYPYLQIYVHTNGQKSNEFSFIIMQQPVTHEVTSRQNMQKFDIPRNIGPHE